MTIKPTSQSSPPHPPTLFVTSPVNSPTATTDMGRRVPLFRYETVVLTTGDQDSFLRSAGVRAELLLAAERQYLASLKQDLDFLVRIAEAAPMSNCHGWFFAGGQFGIEDGHVGTILSENGYVPVAEPRAGDLAIYRRAGELAHSGLVRALDGGSVMVESKWGPFGVFVHPADRHPYDECQFLRSLRAGHRLRFNIS